VEHEWGVEDSAETDPEQTQRVAGGKQAPPAPVPVLAASGQPLLHALPLRFLSLEVLILFP
jgi:hypothetical protein